MQRIVRVRWFQPCYLYRPGEAVPPADPAGLPSAAPQGGGGPGYFNQPLSPSDMDPPTSTEPPIHGQADPMQAGGTANPPPATTPSTQTIANHQTAVLDVNVEVQVLADTTDSNLPARSAITRFNSSGITSVGAQYNWATRQGVRVVTQITRKFQLTGAITIQTAYGSSARPTDSSLYGRGTTATDRRNGDTTLGFHESCHREDFLTYLTNNALPVFGGQVGQRVSAFNAAAQTFNTAYQAYFPAMDAYSEQRTDEVGYTLTQCRSDGRCS